MFELIIGKEKDCTERHYFKTAQEMRDYISSHWNNNWEYWMSPPDSPIAIEIRDI